MGEGAMLANNGQKYLSIPTHLQGPSALPTWPAALPTRSSSCRRERRGRWCCSWATSTRRCAPCHNLQTQILNVETLILNLKS